MHSATLKLSLSTTCFKESVSLIIKYKFMPLLVMFLYCINYSVGSMCCIKTDC